MLPSIFCFDDGYLRRFFSKTTQNYVAMADRISVKCQNKPGNFIWTLDIAYFSNRFSNRIRTFEKCFTQIIVTFMNA